MRVQMQIEFDEVGVLRLLQALAEHNATLLRRDPNLPLLYDSCVVYLREQDETFCDVLNMHRRGEEDCDGLAAARAGELMARGYRALRSGEPGYKAAYAAQLQSIPAQVMLTTYTAHGVAGLYHCIVRYWVNGKEYRDDPSARLGMLNRHVDPSIQRNCHMQKLSALSWRTE